jgi:NAD(P)-dependent dehydrogenase (short-subunit alcohol dehydrogenase family)
MKIEKLFNVTGLTAAVTGGASGIGLAYAQALADNGARVTLLDIDRVALKRAVAQLRKTGGDVDGESLDVTDRAAVKRAIDAVAKHYGRLDVVFANAGIDPGPGFMGIDGKRNPAGKFENYPDEMWDKVIATNLTGVYATIKAAIPHMRRQKGGRIIVTTSVASTRPEAIIAGSYMAAKAGAAHLVRQLSIEYAPYNILINSIAPGAIITNIGGGHAKTKPVQKAFSRMTPLGRMADTDEMQGIALFLASPASSFVTGAEFLIDGGMAHGMHLGS